jgi:hypothetical protein
MARMLRISPNTEREYRKALEAAGLLIGDPNKQWARYYLKGKAPADKEGGGEV